MVDINIDISELLDPIKSRLDEVEMVQAMPPAATDQFGTDGTEPIYVRLTERLEPGESAEGTVVNFIPADPDAQPATEDCYATCDTANTVVVNDARCLVMACEGDVIRVKQSLVGCEYDTMFAHQIHGVRGKLVAPIDADATGLVEIEWCGKDPFNVQAKNPYCFRLFPDEPVTLSLEVTKTDCKDMGASDCCAEFTCEWHISSYSQMFHQGCGTVLDVDGNEVTIQVVCDAESTIIVNCVTQTFEIGEKAYYMLGKSAGDCEFSCEYMAWGAGEGASGCVWADLSFWAECYCKKVESVYVSGIDCHVITIDNPRCCCRPDPIGCPVSIEITICKTQIEINVIYSGSYATTIYELDDTCSDPASESGSDVDHPCWQEFCEPYCLAIDMDCGNETSNVMLIGTTPDVCDEDDSCVTIPGVDLTEILTYAANEVDKILAVKDCCLVGVDVEECDPSDSRSHPVSDPVGILGVTWGGLWPYTTDPEGT